MPHVNPLSRPPSSTRNGAVCARALASALFVTTLQWGSAVHAAEPAQAAAAQAGVTDSPREQSLRRWDWGQREFESNCAACHGRDAKGKGPLNDLLRKPAPDLTQLAYRNQGVLPMARLYEVIEGGSIAAHGSRDMPIWGRDYRIRDAEYYIDSPYDPERLVRARILALLEYINRVQAR